MNKVILLLITLAISLTAKEVSTTSQEVEYKGDTITVPVSKEQTNKIILPAKINSKVSPKEKNLEISITGNQAFVKFAPTVEITKSQMDAEKGAKVEKQEIKYTQSTPTDVHFLAEDDITYSFILVPSTMDSQTITVTNKQQKRKELSFKESQTPFINNLNDITKKFFSGKPLAGYEIQERNEEIATSEKINIILTKVVKGAKYDVFKLSLVNKTNQGVELEERNLIGIVDRPTYRIAIFYDNDVYEIPPKGAAEALVIVSSEESTK